MLRDAVLAALIALAPAAGCGAPPPVEVALRDATVDVGCGACQFKQPAGRGCYWAVRLEDAVYPMTGQVLPSEQALPSHGPEGMCTLTRQAVVDGQLHGGIFAVTRFRLLPLDPSQVEPAEAHDHDHDHD